MVNGPSYTPGDVSTPRVDTPSYGGWTWVWNPLTITWVKDYSGNPGISPDTTLPPGYIPSSLDMKGAVASLARKVLTTPMWWPLIAGGVWLLMMKGHHATPKH